MQPTKKRVLTVVYLGGAPDGGNAEFTISRDIVQEQRAEMRAARNRMLAVGHEEFLRKTAMTPNGASAAFGDVAITPTEARAMAARLRAAADKAE